MQICFRAGNNKTLSLLLKNCLQLYSNTRAIALPLRRQRFILIFLNIFLTFLCDVIKHRCWGTTRLFRWWLYSVRCHLTTVRFITCFFTEGLIWWPILNDYNRRLACFLSHSWRWWTLPSLTNITHPFTSSKWNIPWTQNWTSKRNRFFIWRTLVIVGWVIQNIKKTSLKSSITFWRETASRNSCVYDFFHNHIRFLNGWFFNGNRGQNVWIVRSSALNNRPFPIVIFFGFILYFPVFLVSFSHFVFLFFVSCLPWSTTILCSL